MVSSTPRPHFTPRKDPVPISQESGWAPGPVWTGGKSRSHRESIPDRPARSSVAIPTELPGPLPPPPHTHIYRERERKINSELENLAMNTASDELVLIWLSIVYSLRQSQNIKRDTDQPLTERHKGLSFFFQNTLILLKKICYLECVVATR